MGPGGTSDSLVSQPLAQWAIPKLRDDGSNWVDYESRTKIVLGSKGLIKHVEGTARRPTPFTLEAGVPVTAPGTPATDEMIEAKERKVDKYEQKEFTARHIILTSVPPRLSSMIKAKNAKDMWDKVKKDATTRTKIFQSDTRRCLQDMRCDENGDMKTHLTDMVQLRDELVRMGSSVLDEEFLSFILSSLLPSYRTLLTSVMIATTVSGNDMQPDALMSIVLQEASHREIAERSSKSGEAALVASKPARGRGRGKGRGKAKAGGVKCGNCGRDNHDTPECFQKGGAKEGQAPWQKKAAKAACTNVTSTSMKEDTSDVIYAFTCTSSYANAAARPKGTYSDSVLDCAATDHFCPEEVRFENYRKIKPSPITAADGGTFNAIG